MLEFSFSEYGNRVDGALSAGVCWLVGVPGHVEDLFPGAVDGFLGDPGHVMPVRLRRRFHGITARS
jgi:hypothetical protein